MSKKYTAEEVAKHNIIDGPNKSTWVTFQGKVYDVTNFVAEHPGGTEVLADVAGKDITRSFTEIGHSDYARNLMNPMLLGDLEGYTAGATNSRRTPAPSATKDAASAKPSGGLSPALIALIVVVVAAVAYGIMSSL